MKHSLLAILTFLSFALNAVSPAVQEIFDLFGVEAKQAEQLWIQKGKERWEFDKRYEFMRPMAWPLFEKAGLVFEVPPQQISYEYAIVYGALLSSVERRITYLAKLANDGVRFERIVFLTGERELLPSETALCGVKLESEMVEWVYMRSDLPKEIPAIFIFSPKPQTALKRPTTSDTVTEWLKSDPKPGRCLGISSQPYVGYQHAVMKSLLPHGFHLETAGPAIQGEPTVALMLDTIAKQIAVDD